MVLFIITFLFVLVWPITYFKENLRVKHTFQTIFEEDYQAKQKVLRNINLYPNIPLARLFQNKAIVVTSKYLDNFFSLIDPNYYFFASHPREVVNGQNYFRMPFILMLPLFRYILRVKDKSKKSVLLSTLFVISALSFLKNYYQYDLLLWPFVSYMIVKGLK